MNRIEALVTAMKAEPRDFTLREIYTIACRPPHQDGLSTDDLHRRCGRAIHEARKALGRAGYKLVFGELRSSYRAVPHRHKNRR